MLLQISVALIELQEFAVALTVIALLAAGAGFAWYNFRAQKTKVKADAIKDWRDVVDAQNKKIELLEEGLTSCQKQHENDARKINNITAFNLRLQGREVHYQRTINELQGNLGIPMTDWNLLTDAAEDSDFR